MDMNKFRFLGILLGIFLQFSIIFAQNSPPNVVFILVDDLGWKDLSSYGSEFYDTPHLDSLAARSIRFTQAYAASPVCSPTRAAIQTGKHPARIRITDWIPGMNISRAIDPTLQTPEDLHNLPLKEFTLAEAFKDQGYKTFFAGKWHLGESESHWPLTQGYDQNKGGNHRGSPTFPEGKGYYAPYNNPTLSNGPTGEYLTDRLTEESLHFMETEKDGPFFLFLSYYSVHTPIQGCLSYDSLYEEKKSKLPLQGELQQEPEGDGQTRINQSDPKYAAMVRSVDTNVGKILRKLEDLELMENTLIVFTSDNGGLSTIRNAGPTSVRPLRAGKGWCYEGGIRIPTLIYAPKLAHAGETCSDPIISMDFYPTLLELAGIPLLPKQHVDGKSLVPLLKNPDGEMKRSLVWHYPHYHGSMWRPGSAIREGQFKLIYDYEAQQGKLYDLEADLAEKEDLSQELPERAEQLEASLMAQLSDMEAQFPVEKTPDRPNIVWIVSEDNSKHYMGLYEDQGTPMPNLESLAQKGLVFNNMFSNGPVCSVARSTIISGCYAPRVGSQYHRRTAFAPMPEGVEMFPAYLRKAGYYTSNNAKEDYNLIKENDVWDNSSKRATYRDRKPGQAFFHVQNFHITHEGQLHFTPEQMASRKTTRNPEEFTPFPYHPNTPTFRYTYAWYDELHRKLDQDIGAFLDQLENDGLMENTIIFYYGDHGGVLPRSKGYIYESGIHVPLIVYIPEKWKDLAPALPGSRIEGFTQFIDLGPTVLNLAGIETPKGMDGKPFLGETVSLEELNSRNTAFSHADRFDEKYDLVRGWRKGNFKYIRNFQPFNYDGLYNFYRYRMLAYKEWEDLYHKRKLNKAQLEFFERRSPEALYDLENDPHETNNLAKDPAYREALMELRKELTDHLKSLPDLSFIPEPDFVVQGLGNPVEFGAENQDEIEELIEIANLSLLPFPLAKIHLKDALNSHRPWKRYWAMVVCSSFGKKARYFSKHARLMIDSEPDNLAKLRAIEFLALIGNKKVEHELYKTLEKAETLTEANLILNTITLLQDMGKIKKKPISEEIFPPAWLENKNSLVFRRLEYLNGR